MTPLCKYCGPIGGPLPDSCMNCNSLVEASKCPWITMTDWEHLEKEINRLRKKAAPHPSQDGK